MFRIFFCLVLIIYLSIDPNRCEYSSHLLSLTLKRTCCPVDANKGGACTNGIGINSNFDILICFCHHIPTSVVTFVRKIIPQFIDGIISNLILLFNVLENGKLLFTESTVRTIKNIPILLFPLRV